MVVPFSPLLRKSWYYEGISEFPMYLLLWSSPLCAQVKHSPSPGMWKRKVFIPLPCSLYKLREPSGKRRFLSDLWVVPAEQSEVTEYFESFVNAFMQVSVRACEAVGGKGKPAWGGTSRLESFPERRVKGCCLGSHEILQTRMTCWGWGGWNCPRLRSHAEELFELCQKGWEGTYWQFAKEPQAIIHLHKKEVISMTLNPW